MRGVQRLSMVFVATVAACAMGAHPDVRSPLGAHLSPSAMTGAPVALRADPNAKVIISKAASLPAASYKASQADRGAKLYDSTCALCHGVELVGERFVASWNDRRVYDLYMLVRATMPLDKPGGMKDAEYLDVIAYLLRANKHAPGGTDSLRADTASLRHTKISVGG